MLATNVVHNKMSKFLNSLINVIRKLALSLKINNKLLKVFSGEKAFCLNREKSSTYV